METYSYHIFYFPFKWELRGSGNKLFTEQTDLERIPLNMGSFWKRVQYNPEEGNSLLDDTDIQERKELFGELQYYFDFVHPVLYDKKGEENPIIFHFEREEPKRGNVEYHITVRDGEKRIDKEYVLQVDAINLNLYSTGVGILSFYLANKKENQQDESSVRDINQFGRRIMPPHSGEFDADERRLLAKSIVITGLEGDSHRYLDLFDYKILNGGNIRGLSNTWEPAVFIDSLIKDLSTEMEVKPVIDDRMLVNCWYGNDELSDEIKKNKDFVNSDFWYQYVFVDNGKEPTCMNREMRKDLLAKSTYLRWQETYGTLYGVTRYSLVVLTKRNAFNFIGMHMRTIYSRMFELIIIQRASILRFSSEVTKVSCLSKGSRTVLAERISSLYKEYIRFVNQVYFQSVTAQDQGIELYNMMMEQFLLAEKVKNLDDEIGELNQYITLIIDQKRSENGEWLNKLAAYFLPATVMTGVLGMNPFGEGDYWMSLSIQIIIILLLSVFLYHFLFNKKIK